MGPERIRADRGAGGAPQRTLALALVAALAGTLACDRTQRGAATGPAPAVSASAAGAASGTGPPADPDDPASWAPLYREMAARGDGFVVWESKRNGHWRIWLRPLDGSPERQISPDEEGRDHVAAHVSPDGHHLVYLSLPAPHKDFKPLPPDAHAPLHLVRLGAAHEVLEDRVLVPDAHPYYQSRVAVWRSPRELIYVAGDDGTRLLDLVTGEERELLPRPRSGYGMLIDATLSHATSGRPSFAVYHASDRTLSARSTMRGCEPYFTADGRYGFWMAGAGGPVRKMDLADGTSTVLIPHSSPLLPKGHAYVYYPMVSHDQRLFTFGASRNKHGHFEVDFDVFVVPLDPDTLELTGSAVRYSFSPGQDRFPDAYLSGMELGRHSGESPLRVALHPDPDRPDEPWRFEYGDGSPPGTDPVHVFAKPGSYRVTAERAGERLAGEVRVSAGAPPRPLRAEVKPGGRGVTVVFDEPVDVTKASAELTSGTKLEALAAGDGGRELEIALAAPLAGSDRLRVRGVTDRASDPHAMAPAELPLEIPDWPGTGEGLAFVFANDGAANTGPDLDTGRERAFTILPHARGRFDADGALRAAGGWFEAEDLPARLAAAFRESGAFTLELTVWPSRVDTSEPTRTRHAESTRIFSLAQDGKRQNLSLSQRGQHAYLRIRTSANKEQRNPGVEFGTLVAGEPQHLLVSYSPGRVVAYQNGERVLATDAIQGTLANWRDGAKLSLGADPDGGAAFSGRIEGVALYDRVFEPAEAMAHATAYLHRVKARAPVARLAFDARLVATSLLPTPEQIAPYREALVVNEYQPLAGADASLPARLRVAHWAVLDAQSQPVPARSDGAPVRLVLEPFARHARLESEYVSDTLDPDPDVPLYVDVAD